MQDRRQDFNTRVEALKLGMDDDLSCDRGAGQNPMAVRSGAGWGLRVDGVPPNSCAESSPHDLGM